MGCLVTFSQFQKKNFKIFFILLYEDDYKIAAYTNVTNHGMTPKLPAVLDGSTFIADTPQGGASSHAVRGEVFLFHTCAFKHLGSEHQSRVSPCLLLFNHHF